MVNAAFLELFLNANIQYLSRNTSDHALLLIRLEEFHSSYGFSSFKFHQMWVTHEFFSSCIAAAWEDDIVDYGMVRLVRKLKWLKPVFWVWNLEVFGIGHLEETLAKLEAKMQGEFNEEDEQVYLVTKAELYVDPIGMRSVFANKKNRVGYHTGKLRLNVFGHSTVNEGRWCAK